MEKLHVLGTGYALATRCYNTCFAMTNDQGTLLVDAGGGNGILRQMEDANLSFADVHDLFITHAHPDHLNGVVWVMRKIMTMMNAGKYEGELHIYCHETVRKGLEMIGELMLQKKMLKHIGSRVFFHDIVDGTKATLNGYEVTFFDIGSTKLLQFGFTTTLHNGKKLTCLGDGYIPITPCMKIMFIIFAAAFSFPKKWPGVSAVSIVTQLLQSSPPPEKQNNFSSIMACPSLSPSSPPASIPPTSVKINFIRQIFWN